MCGRLVETSLLEGDVTPGPDESLTRDCCTSTLPSHDLKAKKDGPAQFFGRKAAERPLHLEWLQMWALSDSPQNQD